VAEIVRAEGQVRLSARGLVPAPGQHYVMWLTTTKSNEAFLIGEVIVASDGTATLDLLLPDPIPDNGWNGVLVSVEDSAAPPHPGARRAIAGVYPSPLPAGVGGPGLPNTGLGGMADLAASASVGDDVSFADSVSGW
jgi:hypothetical protein